MRWQQRRHSPTAQSSRVAGAVLPRDPTGGRAGALRIPSTGQEAGSALANLKFGALPAMPVLRRTVKRLRVLAYAVGHTPNSNIDNAPAAGSQVITTPVARVNLNVLPKGVTGRFMGHFRHIADFNRSPLRSSQPLQAYHRLGVFRLDRPPLQ